MSISLKKLLRLDVNLCKMTNQDEKFLEVCVTPAYWKDWVKFKLGNQLPETTKWNIKEENFVMENWIPITVARKLSSEEVLSFFKENYTSSDQL